jgi:hypothetical protein
MRPLRLDSTIPKTLKSTVIEAQNNIGPLAALVKSMEKNKVPKKHITDSKG